MKSPTSPAPDAFVKIFSQLAEHTRPACGACRSPHRCCSRPQCEETMRFAHDTFGVDLEQTGHPTLPLMGKNGCTAAPHLRPLCSVHVCEQHLTATATQSDNHDAHAAWIDKYWALREAAEEQLEAVMFGPPLVDI